MSKPSAFTLASLASGEPEFREVGVGPWAQTHPDEPRPDDPASEQYDPRYDSELLDNGDRRNVLDAFRYWSVEAIRDELDSRGRHLFEVAIENWTHDFNIGSIVRTANAFAAAKVHIVGPHKWNRKGALMTELYQHVEQHPSMQALLDRVKAADEERDDGTSTRIIAIDNVPGAVAIERFEFPERCLLIFGAEGPGLSEKALTCADDVVFISQYGSVRSINAGAAAAVAMHSWIEQHGRSR